MITAAISYTNAHVSVALSYNISRYSYSESITLSEAMVFTHGRGLTEDVVLIELFSARMSRPIVDLIDGITDSNSMAFTKSITDSIFLTDSATTIEGIGETISDSASISDDFEATAGKVFTDNTGTSDNLVIIVNSDTVLPPDFLTASDTMLMTVNPGYSEALTVSDVVDVIMDYDSDGVEPYFNGSVLNGITLN